MNLNEYKKHCLETWIYSRHLYTTKEFKDNTRALLGLVGEVGEVTEAYKKYLRNPYVSVKILNQRLFVLGEVNAPGVVPLHSGTMTLFEALATAGDLTIDGKRTDILIIRGDLRNPQIREIDLTNIKKLKLASLILRPNDIVYVQPRDFKAFNKGLSEKAEFFNFLNTVMSPFLSFSALDEAYGWGILPEDTEAPGAYIPVGK